MRAQGAHRSDSLEPLAPFEECFRVGSLHRAFLRALRRHRRDPEAAAFAVEAGPRLCALSRSVLDGTYAPGPLRTFLVREPKPRMVASCPFVDRVVHHALVGALQAALEPLLFPASYACRRGKGLHRAVRHAQELLWEHPFVLSLDVQRYFERLPHATILGVLSSLGVTGATGCGRRYLSLCACVLSGPAGEEPAADRGMPIGTLTSQLFGNLGLHPVDTLVRDDFPDVEHIRYMDDLVVFGPSKRRLWEVREAVRERLARESLDLRPDATRLAPAREGVHFLGVHVLGGGLRLARRTRVRIGRRIRATVRAVSAGRLPASQGEASIRTRLQHAALSEGPVGDAWRRAVASRVPAW